MIFIPLNKHVLYNILGGLLMGDEKGIWASSKATQGAMIPRLNEDPFYIDQEMGRDTLLSGLFALSTAYIKLIYKTPPPLSLLIMFLLNMSYNFTFVTFFISL